MLRKFVSLKVSISMYHLGIFGGNGPNPAAAILAKGKLIAFAEEERFCRIKNAPSQLPIRSILFCFKKPRYELLI